MQPDNLRVTQVAFVVEDLERTVAGYQALSGWGPWSVYEYQPPQLRDLRVRGEPAEFTWIGAEAEVGSVWVEVLQPVSGGGPLRDWLDRHGEGVHHLGYWAETMAESEDLRARFERQGAELLMSAWIGDVFFFYMDAAPVIYEVWTGDLDSLRASRTIGAAQ